MDEGDGLHKSKGLGMVLGVVASVATMNVAAPMLAMGGMTALSGGAMMAGGVLTGVGAITGNSKLAKIGGVLSLAGGVGAFASGGSSAFGMGSGAEAGAANSTVIPNTSTSMMERLTENASSVTGVPASSGSVSMMETLSQAAPSAGDAASGTIGLASSGSAAPSISNGTAAPFVTQPAKGFIAGAIDKAKDVGGSVLDFANKNPVPTQIAGAMLQSGMGPDQQGVIDSQTGYYNAKAAETNATSIGQGLTNDYAAQRLANMNNQVEIISGDDPQAQQKIADAIARNAPYKVLGKGAPVTFNNKSGGVPLINQPANA
jgi:hypothetical protein